MQEEQARTWGKNFERLLAEIDNPLFVRCPNVEAHLRRPKFIIAGTIGH